MEAIAFLLSPVIALFVNSQGWLPSWLWAFQTPDNSCDGDEGHWMRWENRSAYVRRTAWLARNRAYGFKLLTIGCWHQGYTVAGDSTIGNRHNASPGSFFLRGNLGNWYYKTIKPIGFNYCIQLALGWQLDAPIAGRCLFMFSPRITKFYKG
jgi:hypothetical protein